MRYTGEGASLPKESNSQAFIRTGPGADTTLESPVRAPKVQERNLSISQAKGQRIAYRNTVKVVFPCPAGSVIRERQGFQIGVEYGT